MDIENIGVGIIIKNIKTGKYYLVKERNTNKKTDKHFGEYSIVVGHVRKGESLSDAALREIKEELDIKISLPIQDFVGICYFLKGEIVIIFLVETIIENSARGLWFSINEIRELENLRSGTLKVIEKFEHRGFKGLDTISTF